MEYLKGINFREDFREHGKCKFSRGLNFANFARTERFLKMQKLKTRITNRKNNKKASRQDISVVYREKI